MRERSKNLEEGRSNYCNGKADDIGDRVCEKGAIEKWAGGAIDSNEIIRLQRPLFSVRSR
ncbi:MAG: hypothetical protein HC840_12825 [Leptolyngbyaceae cyanobacterium RM2_2_4]|nr:hypothetical protein [Leptolyngbyaceae cyanobacterium SM1_4_3]NJO50166.1 hypothetical protein [Leptolyngbyaceae cyanobacterium RM2_2_4]